MGHKPRIKMPIAERAKQFAPFTAIRGLSEALRKKEQEINRHPQPMLPKEYVLPEKQFGETNISEQ